MYSHRTAFRILRVTGAATVALIVGCTPAITPRPPTVDPTSAQSSEAPRRPAPPLTTADPLLTIAAEPLGEPQQDAPMKMQHDKDGHGGHHMHGPGNGHGPRTDKPTPSPSYSCPMHPEVRSDKADRCDKCGMKLMPTKDKSEGKGDAP